jgi:hypothetical protein
MYLWGETNKGRIKDETMRVLRRIRIQHDYHDNVIHADIKSLAVWKRLFHPKAKRHVVAISLGCALMVGGSFCAKHPDIFGFAPELLVDVFGYFLHGCGSVPFLRHVEPLWALLSD